MCLGSLGKLSPWNLEGLDAAGAGIEAGGRSQWRCHGNKAFGKGRMSSQQGRERSVGCWDGCEGKPRVPHQTMGDWSYFCFPKDVKKWKLILKKG